MNITMEPQDKWISWLWVVFLLLIGGGGLCIWYFHDKFFHSLGHALIIAGFLGLTVDTYAKRHLVREAARDIDKYLLGYALPSELQDTIREVRATKVVRRNWVCVYTISPSGSEKQIKLEAHLTFLVENITNRRQYYMAELELDEHTSPEIVMMSCHSSDKQQIYSLDGSTLAKQILKFTRAYPGAATVQVKADRVELQPKSKYPHLYYEFQARYSQIYAEIGREHFQFDQPLPTIGVTIIVNHPKGFKISFPSKPKKVEPERSEWSDSKVFLRGEIITIWWRPDQADHLESNLTLHDEPAPNVLFD